jgi:hypothetical protein
MSHRLINNKDHKSELSDKEYEKTCHNENLRIFSTPQAGAEGLQRLDKGAAQAGSGSGCEGCCMGYTTGTYDPRLNQGLRSAVARIICAARCATINVGALVFADVIFGKTDASTTRNASIP